MFIYGGGFLDKDDKSKLPAGFSIPADAPPVFMLVAHDDKSNPIEAAMLYLEYKKRDLSAKLHICAKGATDSACAKAASRSTTGHNAAPNG